MKCPLCNEKLVDIVYGLPTVELMDKSKNKEVCLGGCVIMAGVEIPKFHCFKCNNDFNQNLQIYKKNKSNE